MLKGCRMDLQRWAEPSENGRIETAETWIDESGTCSLFQVATEKQVARNILRSLGHKGNRLRRITSCSVSMVVMRRYRSRHCHL